MEISTHKKLMQRLAREYFYNGCNGVCNLLRNEKPAMTYPVGEMICRQYIEIPYIVNMLVNEFGIDVTHPNSMLIRTAFNKAFIYKKGHYSKAWQSIRILAKAGADLSYIVNRVNSGAIYKNICNALPVMLLHISDVLLSKLIKSGLDPNHHDPIYNENILETALNIHKYDMARVIVDAGGKLSKWSYQLDESIRAITNMHITLPVKLVLAHPEFPWKTAKCYARLRRAARRYTFNLMYKFVALDRRMDDASPMKYDFFVSISASMLDAFMLAKIL
jgi:hypothetical protein